MGYYSDFEIKAYKGKLTDEIRNRLEEISDYSFDIVKRGESSNRIVSCDSYKWYDYNNDMVKLSTEYPKVLFSLTWVGEDDARGRLYCFNGKYQEVNASITYPAPDMKKLKGSKDED